MRRKKPRREDSGCAAEERTATDTDDTAMDTWPLCVNPNFSKRIMGLVSEFMVRDLISAVEGERRDQRKRRVVKRDGFVLILEIAIVGGMWKERDWGSSGECSER